MYRTRNEKIQLVDGSYDRDQSLTVGTRSARGLHLLPKFERGLRFSVKFPWLDRTWNLIVFHGHDTGPLDKFFIASCVPFNKALIKTTDTYSQFDI